jgi:hypothetical protein
MKVKINRDVCDAHLAFCENCLGRFLKEPMGYERHCFEELEDDNSEILTIELKTDGRELTLELTEEERLLAAGEGWASLMDFEPDMYRNKR